MTRLFNPNILAIARGSRGLSQSDFAERLGWSQGKASKVEHGMIQLSDDEAQSVARVLDYPVRLFYEEQQVRGFGTCCLFHRKRTTTPIRLLNQLHDVVNIRRIQISRLLQGIALPQEVNFPTMDIDEYESPEHIARMLRAAWGLPRGPIKNLVDAVEAAGGLILLTDLNTPKIDAVSQRADGIPPIFFLDRVRSADRSRYTLAHEIGHIIMHRTPSSNAEVEADRFAAEFLMPACEIEGDLRKLSIPKASALKLKWRVAMQAVIRRAKDTGAINAAAYQSLCVRISQLGYRNVEPNPIEPEIPRLIRRLISVYLSERGYSVGELSAAMLSSEKEFREIYLRDETQPQLRLIE